MNRNSRLRSAPSVSFPVGRSRFQGQCLAAIWLLGALAVVLWWAQAAIHAWQLSLALALLAGGGMLSWRHWARAPMGTLHWREQQWHFSPGAATTADIGDDPVEPLDDLQVVLDLQSVLLLRCAVPGQWRGPWGGQWFWLARRDDPVRWHALRRAAFARAGTGNPDKNPAIGRARSA